MAGRSARWSGIGNTLVVDAFDPRVPSAANVDYMNNRANTVCYTPYNCVTRDYPRAQQKYVPKYLVILRGGKVADCKAVDLSKVGVAESHSELFRYPCSKSVPGFK